MTDWGTVAIIILLWPFEMLGTSYFIAWMLKRSIKDFWRKEEAKKKWKWPWSA